MLYFDWHELAQDNFSLFEKGSAVSIGSFDGLHQGHCALLKRLMDKGRDFGLPCGVITFSSPPRYLFRSSAPQLISTVRLKKEQLKKIGLDFVIVVDCSLEFAKMTGDYFLALLKKYINFKYLLVGEDFRFGRERSSSIEDMSELSFKFSFSFEAFANLQDAKGELKISSSFIRKAIYEGNLKAISSLLQDGVNIDLLDAKPYCLDEGEMCFLKADLSQVLPKTGEFLGTLCFLNGREKEIKVLFDARCVRLIYGEKDKYSRDDFGEGEPHLNILKLKEKFKE